MTLRIFCTILAFFMLGYVALVVLTYGKTLGEVIVGLVAGCIVAACAIALYVYEKKGELR